jgi:hypothetical protein
MNRLAGEIVFCVVLVAFVGGVAWQAREWDLRAQLFPLTIALPLLALALIQLGLSAWRAFAPAPAAEEEKAAPGAVRKGLVTAGWILGFAAAIWLAGFPIGSALASLVFLRFKAAESWKLAIIYAAITYACLVVGFDYALKTTFPPGVLQTLLR